MNVRSSYCKVIALIISYNKQISYYENKFTWPPSPSTLCSSLHSSIVWARSTWHRGTFTSPIWSCLENLSKSKIAKTSVLFIASAYATPWERKRKRAYTFESIFQKRKGADSCVRLNKSKRNETKTRGENATDLERESLIENWTQRFPVHFRLEFLLLVRQQVNLHVRIGGATHVQSWQLLRLYHSHCQTVRVEIVLELQESIHWRVPSEKIRSRAS